MIKITVPIHSIIGIITNSSSEVYTLKTDQSKTYLMGIINAFCESNKISFRVTEDDFGKHDEDDWEFQDAKRVIEERGFSLIVNPNAPTVLRLSFENNYGLDHVRPLLDFLRYELKAEYDYE